MKHGENIKGIIFDIDGTLTINDQALLGAIETVSWLKAAGYSLRFVTNTTGRTCEQLAAALTVVGFEIDASEIQTSVSSCVHYLLTHFTGKAGYLAVPDAIKPLFDGVYHTETHPEFVVLGDLDGEFDYAILNKVFNFMREGAQLITFHRNPFYFREGKTWLDSGAFTMALEQITGQSAIVTGKPSPAIFESAVDSMGLEKDQVIVVGDDVSSDIQGARNSGLSAYLVGSGKFKPQQLTEHRISAESFLEQISDLLHICRLNG